MNLERIPADDFIETHERAGDIVIGLIVPRPPDTFAELQAAHEDSKDCPVSRFYDPLIEAIGSSEDPDTTTRQLSYELGSVAVLFALSSDQLRQLMEVK